MTPVFNVAADVRLGADPVQAVYVGSSLVWPSGVDPPLPDGFIVFQIDFGLSGQPQGIELGDVALSVLGPSESLEMLVGPINFL
jgi:hypothetical protein